MRGKKVLILELREKAIKVCRVQICRRRKVIEILRAWEFPERMTPKDIANVFLKFTNKVKYEKIVVSLPRAFFLIRFLKLPSQNKEEMQRMLSFILTKRIVYPLEEIIYDFSLAEVQEGYSKALVFIIPRKKVEELLPAVGRNLRRLSFTITTAGIVNWLAHQKKVSKEGIEYPLIVVDIDKNRGELLVIDKEDVLFSRAFDLGYEGDIQEGISQSLKIFRNEFPRVSFRKIIFTGRNKQGALSRYEDIDAVFIEDKANFSFAAQVKDERPADDSSFAAILGLAVGAAPKFDFSPEVLKIKREAIGKRRRYLGVAVAVLEIILIGSIFAGKYVWDQHRRRQFLKEKLAKVEGPVKELVQIEDRLVVFNNEFCRRLLFGEILRSLFLSLPPEVCLTLADFKEDGDFSLKGYAANDAQVFAAKTALYNSGVFSEVKVKYASKVKQKGVPMVEFYIYGKREFLKEK